MGGGGEKFVWVQRTGKNRNVKHPIPSRGSRERNEAYLL